jgi:hypothetical protein
VKEDLHSTATCRQVVVCAIEDMRVLSDNGRRPIAICIGRVTTGGGNKLQNYTYLKAAIAWSKRRSDLDEIGFDHLPYYQRAVELQRREYAAISVPAIGTLAPPTGDRADRSMSRAIEATMKRREQLRKEFLGPLLESGFIKVIYLLPNSEGSIGTKWWVEKAIKLGIAVKTLPENFA